MLYTLLKFLGWGALLAFVGGCIGWALRSLKCRGELARARTSTVDVDEVERMRHRLANLEQVVAERDRLRIQLADVRHADSPGIVGAEVPEAPTDDVTAHDQQAEASEPDSAPAAESDPADDAHATDDESAAIVPDSEADDAASTSIAGFAAAGNDDATTDDASIDEPEAEAIVELDLAAAADVLGKKIELDDLTVVEGIGPKISELCSGIGVTTWRQLAESNIDELQSMLDAAGSRYTVHKPGTWPRQAELLATGQWAAFKSLTDELDGGK